MQSGMQHLCAVLVTIVLSHGAMSTGGRYCMDTGPDDSEELRMMAKYFGKDIDKLKLIECPVDSQCAECKTVSDSGIWRYQAACRTKSTAKLESHCRISEPCSSATETQCHPILQEIRGNGTKCRAVAIGPPFQDQVAEIEGQSVYCKNLCGALLGFYKQNDLTVFIGCAEECQSKAGKLSAVSTTRGGSEKAACTTCRDTTGCIQIPKVEPKNNGSSWLERKRAATSVGMSAASCVTSAAVALAMVVFLTSV